MILCSERCIGGNYGGHHSFCPNASQPDIGICTSCGEHAEFNKENESECCGSAPYNTDPDLDMER